MPLGIADALDADMQAQKARITRLRNAAVAEGQTLEQKKAAQTQLKGAEFTLQTMRRTRFDAEDAALKAIEQKDMAPFAEHITFFKTEIRTHLGDDAADALTLDHLQGAYIAMAGGKQGADTKRAVIDVETKAEIEAHEAVAVDEDQDGVATERTLTQVLRDELAANRMPKDNPALKKLVESFDGRLTT